MAIEGKLFNTLILEVLMSLSHDVKHCLNITLYVIKEQILYNSVDPDQTNLYINRLFWSSTAKRWRSINVFAFLT